MAAKRPTKDVSIAARITAEQALLLDEIQQLEPALSSRSAAIGRVLDLVADEDIEAYDAAAGKEFAIDATAAVAVQEALAARTRQYSRLAQEFRAIGQNLNQLVKLGHQAKIYGKDGVIVVEAVDAIGRAIDDAIANELHKLALQDAHIETVVRACLPR